MPPPRPLVVLDAANIVGSRPDGWWRDRPAAFRRLIDALPGAVDGDLLVVVEGAARAGIPEPPPEAIEIVAAPRSGDDQIVDVVRSALTADPARPVIVVTSDRALRTRVEALGAATTGPHWLWDQLHPREP